MSHISPSPSRRSAPWTRYIPLMFGLPAATALAAGGTYDGVTFTPAEAEVALDAVNRATRTQLEYPGLQAADDAATLRAGRPWADLGAVSAAAGIDTAAMQGLLRWAQTTGYFAWTGPAHDLNRASPGELDELYGIGPATAEDVVDLRATHGPLEHEDQLMGLDGFDDGDVDALMARSPRAFVAPFLADGTPVDATYTGPYPRAPQVLPVWQVVAQKAALEGALVRIERAAVTAISSPTSSATFTVTDWGDPASPRPTGSVTLKVYLPDRAGAALLTPFDQWMEEEGEPYARANFYRPWDTLEPARIDTRQVYSIEGVLVNDPTYGWELVVRSIDAAGADRITLLESWLDPWAWGSVHAFFDTDHIEARVVPTSSDGWWVELPQRLLYGHPVVAYARAHGSTPPTSGIYTNYDHNSTLAEWFNTWLVSWRADGAPDVAGRLVINEVVKDPQLDWSANNWGSTPGVAVPADGDEFVELYNGSANVIDLTNYKLVMTDSSPATETLGHGAGNVRFTPGSSLIAFQPGHFMVVGNPAGAMNNNAVVELVAPDGVTWDSLSLDGNASSAGDEALARCVDGVDSNTDADWCRRNATPALPNDTSPSCPDGDHDGFTSTACGGDDCDDTRPGVHPDAPETCTNGLDDNCDGLVDGADVDSCPPPCPDADNDGFLAASCGGDDCDDTRPAVHPDAPETCANGLDDNCDGLVDGTDVDSCPPPCPDADNDGHLDAACGGDDCDDTNPTVYPGNTEECTDLVDNNCDGLTDGDDDTSCPTGGCGGRAGDPLSFAALIGLGLLVGGRRMRG